jgi:hypothetical protein
VDTSVSEEYAVIQAGYMEDGHSNLQEGIRKWSLVWANGNARYDGGLVQDHNIAFCYWREREL